MEVETAEGLGEGFMKSHVSLFDHFKPSGRKKRRLLIRSVERFGGVVFPWPGGKGFTP